MMRGLEIRLCFAKGKCTLSIFGDDDHFDDELWEAFAAAKALGHYNYQQGKKLNDFPVLFRDEQPLVYAWQDGWREGRSFEYVY